MAGLWRNSKLTLLGLGLFWGRSAAQQSYTAAVWCYTSQDNSACDSSVKATLDSVLEDKFHDVYVKIGLAAPRHWDNEGSDWRRGLADCRDYCRAYPANCNVWCPNGRRRRRELASPLAGKLRALGGRQGGQSNGNQNGNKNGNKNGNQNGNQDGGDSSSDEDGDGDSSSSTSEDGDDNDEDCSQELASNLRSAALKGYSQVASQVGSKACSQVLKSYTCLSTAQPIV